MMRQIRRPRALDDILGSGALRDNLVAEPASLGQNLDIQRVGKVIAVDNGSIRGVRTAESNRASRLGREQLSNNTESVLAIAGELVELLRPAVALGGEELDVGLLRGQAHGVATGLARRGVPDGGIGEAVIETRKGEDAEREGGEETGLFILPLLVGLFEGVAVVDEVIVRETGFLGFVKDEDNLFL
jgi:hypothetical protein